MTKQTFKDYPGNYDPTDNESIDLFLKWESEQQLASAPKIKESWWVEDSGFTGNVNPSWFPTGYGVSFKSEELARNYILVKRQEDTALLYRIVHQIYERLDDGYIKTIKWIPYND